MALRVTVDLFSGRPNPVVDLDDQASASLLERLRPGARLSDEEGAAGYPEGQLGYRGMLFEQTGAHDEALPRTFALSGGRLLGAGVAHRPADERVEELLLSGDSPLRGSRDAQSVLELSRPHLDELIRVPHRPIFWPPPYVVPCTCGPIYEPAWWNVPSRQPYNNCYNYASNYRSDTFAQPGRAAGCMYQQLTCAAVQPAAAADQLIPAPSADNNCPATGHLVALVIWPNYDFHWYRKGRDGWWSHKPGSTPVTNVDNSGHLIVDPRTANRGPYTDFCTFMVVMHGHIKIN